MNYSLSCKHLVTFIAIGFTNAIQDILASDLVAVISAVVYSVAQVTYVTTHARVLTLELIRSLTDMVHAIRLVVAVCTVCCTVTYLPYTYPSSITTEHHGFGRCLADANQQSHRHHGYEQR